jgi:C-terminal processing protease CtpA/Prc
VKQFKTLINSLVIICAANFAFSNPEAAKAEPFRLGTSTHDVQVAPSNKGILGIKYLHQQNQNSVIIRVYPNTPASKAGIRVGDQIIKANGIDVRPFNANQVYAIIEGPPGESINLLMRRCQGQCRDFTVNLTRMDMNYIPSDNVFNIYKYGH